MRRSINHPDHTLLDDKPVNKQRLSFQGGQKVSKAHGFVETGLTDHPIHKRNPLKSICCHLKWGKRCISKYSKIQREGLKIGCISYNPNHSAKWTCHNLCYALCYLCMHCIWNVSLTNSIHVKTLDLLQVLVYEMKRVIMVFLIFCLLLVLLFLLPTPLRLPSQRPPLQRWNNFNVSNTLPEKLESSFLNSWWSERCQSQKYNIMVQNQIWRGFS